AARADEKREVAHGQAALALGNHGGKGVRLRLREQRRAIVEAKCVGQVHARPRLSILVRDWIECALEVPRACSMFGAGQRGRRVALTECQVLLSLGTCVKLTYYLRLRSPHGVAHPPIPYQARLRNYRLRRSSPAPLERPDGRARRPGVRLVPEGRGLAAEPPRRGGPLPRAWDGRGQSAAIHRCAGEVRSSLSRRRRTEDDDRPRVPRPVLGRARQLAQRGVRASLLGTDDE